MPIVVSILIAKQYKALKEKGWLEGVIQNEAMMSPEEKKIYETSRWKRYYC